MKIKDVIAYVDAIKPNAFPDEVKVQWINEVEGFIQTDVMLLDILEVIRYSFPDDYETELLVLPPHSKIYYAYLTAMVDFANGEYDKYANTMVMYNEFLNEYMIWYADHYRPADGMAVAHGYYISAYGIAVDHGFAGTEEQWLESLIGPRGEPFKYDDFTHEQLELLRGPKGETIDAIMQEEEIGTGGVVRHKITVTTNTGARYEFYVSDGKKGESVTVAEVIESPDDDGQNEVKFSDGTILRIKNGKTGTSVSVAEVIESEENGGENVVKFTDGNEVAIRNGERGDSVYVENVIESDADGGENVVVFSDGKTVRIRNGKNGESITVAEIIESDTDGEESTVTFSDGTVLKIKNGKTGSTGNGIKTAVLNDDYTLTFEFTDGTKYTTPAIRGEKGRDGVPATHSWYGTTLTVTSVSGTSSADLKGEKGDTGETGKGLDIKGTYGSLSELQSAVTAPEQGDMYNVGASAPYTIYMYDAVLGWVSQGQLQGEQGPAGKDGSNGKDGTSVTVANVSESSADGGENIVTFSDGKTVRIKNGSKGSPGTDGEDGAAGKDGISATHTWNGTTLTITSASGTSSADLKGESGKDGSDYVLTAADKTEIAVEAAKLVEVPDIDTSEVVKKSGDTMTGALKLVGDPVEGLDAATKQYVDASKEIVIIEYGSVTYQQVKDLADSGKTVFCKYKETETSEKYILAPLVGVNATSCNFSTVEYLPKKTYTLTCAVTNSDYWYTEKNPVVREFIAEYGITPGYDVYIAIKGYCRLWCKYSDANGNELLLSMLSDDYGDDRLVVFTGIDSENLYYITIDYATDEWTATVKTISG